MKIQSQLFSVTRRDIETWEKQFDHRTPPSLVDRFLGVSSPPIGPHPMYNPKSYPGLTRAAQGISLKLNKQWADDCLQQGLQLSGAALLGAPGLVLSVTSRKGQVAAQLWQSDGKASSSPVQVKNYVKVLGEQQVRLFLPDTQRELTLMAPRTNMMGEEGRFAVRSQAPGGGALIVDFQGERLCNLEAQSADNSLIQLLPSSGRIQLVRDRGNFPLDSSPLSVDEVSATMENVRPLLDS